MTFGTREVDTVSDRLNGRIGEQASIRGHHGELTW